MAESERIGPYRVLQRLGAGGMGEVVLAHDDRLDRLVAIKRLHDKHAATHHSRERFRREARIIARLNHPAIVQLHDVLHQGDHEYLIMEYIDGRTLRARRDAGPMTIVEVLGIAHQIALGMAAAHDLDVIHRDLKAENVLITRTGRAKITDFGIAKLHGEDGLTADEAVVGTFRSMSPEQALGRPVDHRSDLFSFGILLYETLAGESPFHAETPFLIVQRLVMDEPRPIAELVPGIPDELARLIHQLLAKEPVLRPRNFHEVAAALIELAGQVCDAPCHAGVPPGHRLPSGGGDTRPTDETEAPPRPAGAAAALGRASDDTDADARRSVNASRGDPDDAALARRARGSDLDDAALARRARGNDLDDDGRRTVRLRSARSLGAAAPTLVRLSRRRRAWRAAGLGIAVMTALGIGYAARQEFVDAPRVPYLRVAVLAPHVSGAADHPEIASLAVAIRNAVIAGVRARVGLDLVPRGDIETYVEGVTRDTGRPPAQSDIRVAVGADEIITTDMTCLPGSCTVTLERNAGIPGGPPPESFQLAADRAARPGETVAFHLSRLYPDHRLRDGAALGSIAPQDHARFVALVEQYWAGGTARSPAELLAQLEGIRAHSPRSLDVLLFEAEVRRHRYLQTEDRAEAERAIDLLRGADQLFPDTYDILSARFDIVLSARPLDELHVLPEASGLLDRLVTLDPDSSTTHLQRAKLLHARGELSQAIRELDAAAGRDAFSWRVLYHRALVSRKQGDRVATRKAITELLVRSPGNYGGLSLLAREEQREAGRLACAAQIYEGLVAREPLYHECAWLGYTLSQLGRYREASDGFRCALAIRPDDPTSRLNLAESLLVAGDTDGAGDQLRALQELLARKRRASPEGIVGLTDVLVDAQSLAYLGRGDRAMADEARKRVSQLVTLPVRPDVLYTAAVVHAVLGDRDLATRYVTQYLDAGGSPTDFGLPWFADLRRDPALGKRLVVPVVAQTCEASASL